MDPVSLPWRTGGVRRFVQLGDNPSDSDRFVGLMDSPELAAEAVDAQNAMLAVYPQVDGSRP